MPLTTLISNPLSSFCLEASTVLDDMALCRKGSPDKKLFDLGRGLSLDQIGSPLPPHCARVSLKNERWRSGRKAPKVSLLSASGVDSTEGILISPSTDNRDGPPRAQRTTEGHFSVLWALHWCFFRDCYVQLLFSFFFPSCHVEHLFLFPRLPSSHGLPMLWSYHRYAFSVPPGLAPAPEAASAQPSGELL